MLEIALSDGCGFPSYDVISEVSNHFKIKLGYNDHGSNNFTFISHKKSSQFRSWMTSYNVNIHGYKESRLLKALFARPREFVITEFDCSSMFSECVFKRLTLLGSSLKSISPTRNKQLFRWLSCAKNFKDKLKFLSTSKRLIKRWWNWQLVK